MESSVTGGLPGPGRKGHGSGHWVMDEACAVNIAGKWKSLARATEPGARKAALGPCAHPRTACNQSHG